jgi:S1-C subfamily serine protease
MGRVSKLSAACAATLLALTGLVSAAAADDLWVLCGSAKEPLQKLEYCTKLIRTAKSPKFAERGFLGRGNANVELGNFNDAIDDFTRLIAINPRIAGYFDNRLNAYKAIGRYGDALRDANASIQLAPGYAFVYRSRALVYSELGKFGAAIADIDRASAIEPNNSGLLVDRGRVQLKAGRSDAAIDDFTRAIRMDPYQMDALRERGLAYLSIGETDRARNDLSVVIAARPNDIEIARALDEIQKPSRGPVDGRPPSSEKSATSGTGFFVGPEGYLVTNAHVVEGCNAPKITSGLTSPVSARVLARDGSNDLALIKGDLKPTTAASLRAGVKIGEAIATFGYPLAGLLSTKGNFTTGNISAISGLGDDSRFLQITAPVQPGSSGGPMIDQAGNVVGVVVGKLDAIKLAAAIEDVPQNVNFAIKTSVLMNFLDVNGINYATAGAGQTMPSADLAEKARTISVLIECEK